MLLFGAITGWLASRIFLGRGLGLFGNVIAGILGSVFGYWLFGEFGIQLCKGAINTLLQGLCGAAGIIILINLIFPGRAS